MKVTYIYNPAHDAETRSTKGVVTIVSDSLVSKLYGYGLAFCVPGDNFEKQRGIALATQRLNTGDRSFSGFVNLPLNCTPTYKKILYLILSHTMTNPDVPDWAYELLRAKLIGMTPLLFQKGRL